MAIKELIKNLPLAGNLLVKFHKHLKKNKFNSSGNYWEKRYAAGGDSGPGSYDELATFKAEIINDFVKTNCISSVIEFGCGDGNQLMLAKYPEYTGFDISSSAIKMCKGKFFTDKTKSFLMMADYKKQKSELVLSLDVIYHLVEDNVFEEYIKNLFSASAKFVIIYSSNNENNSSNPYAHIKHRNFHLWVKKNEPDWKLLETIPNRYPQREGIKGGSFADFYIYQKQINTEK